MRHIQGRKGAARLFSIVAGLLLLALPAHAQECTGTDLLAQLGRDDPQRLEQIEADAAKIENGNALLWKIERQGTAPSWLFGTMHVTDPRIRALPAPVEQALGEANTVVLETTDILDRSAMMAALASRPDLMVFTDDTTLTSLLDPEDTKLIDETLRERGMSLSSVNKMKPWMLSAMIVLPACELARQAGGEEVLDAELARLAEAGGKPVEGLETALDQLGAMASLPMDLHVRGLVDTLKLNDELPDIHETMIAIYLRGQPGLFWPFFHAILATGKADEAGFAAFEQTMITARNHTMAENAQAMLEKGGAFIAVGAMHLPGEEGLVKIFREQGYEVTAILP